MIPLEDLLASIKTIRISPTYSPRMTMHQALDYEKHWSIPFSTYIQVHTKSNPKNTQQSQTLDCYNQGGHHLLDLQTG
jgi:hypothetical protein